MADSEKVDSKYTFENTENSVIYDRYNNMQRPAYLTVSNGNHVKVTSETGSQKIWFLNVNMSSFATNGQKALDITDTWFTVPSGSTVKWCFKNLTSTAIEQLCVGMQASGDSLALYSIGGDRVINRDYIVSNEFTKTVDRDLAVTSVAFGVILGENSCFEFDFELYVNGERYI